MSIYKEIIFVVCFFVSLSAYSESEYEKGDLVCSISDSVCGIVFECAESICEIHSTHLIKRTLPSRIKPQYIEIKQVNKSNVYKSDKSLSQLKEKAAATAAENTKHVKKYSKLCYFIKYSNVEGGETRCGSLGNCNENQCQVRETHIKISSPSGFVVWELPLAYQDHKQVDKSEIFTDGDIVEDFILWGMVDNEFIKLIM